jgi:glutaredoxin
MRRLTATLLVAMLVALLSGGCRRKEAPGTDGAALPSVTDASSDLILTWIDERGEFHVEQRAADVPPGARDVVRVADPAHAPPEGRVYVADLRNARPDGTYPVQAMEREAFEALAVERRKKHGGVLAASPPRESAETGNGPEEQGSPAERPSVIIYGASWCGPCHQAAAYLKSKGVAFVERDIEEDGSAAREMQAKLAKAGKRGGSIPVLDVRGKILVGFDPGAVETALRAD